mgnify:CR=1 FL=1
MKAESSKVEGESWKEKMKLPEIGDRMNTKEALELCRYFGLDYLVERIESDPERYWELLFSRRFTPVQSS